MEAESNLLPQLLHGEELVRRVGTEDAEAIKTELAARVRRSLPTPVITSMRTHGLFMAGGYLRSTLVEEKPADIDLFGPDEDTMNRAIEDFLDTNEKATIGFRSRNAVTIYLQGSKIQFILADCRPTLIETVMSFDFTICQAGIMITDEGAMEMVITDDFLNHTSKNLLRYTRPVRNQEPGAPMRRMLSFVARGFKPDFKSIASVSAILMQGTEEARVDPYYYADDIHEVLEQSLMNGNY